MLHPTLSVKEAAGYLKVQPRTVRCWIACGKLTACKVGKAYIIPIEEIGKLISTFNASDEMKMPDSARKTRIAMMKGSLIGTGVTSAILDHQHRREIETRRSGREFRL